MPEKVYYGDEWKNCDDAPAAPAAAVVLRRRTRAEQQRYLDDQYGQGKITVEQWRMQTAMTSNQRADGSPILTLAAAAVDSGR
jgi:hypothetical protein